MFAGRWRLFNLFGIPISVDLSWLIILALITWTLADGIFRQELPDVSNSDRWLLGLATALLFFGCIVLHEMGHALVARATGIPIRGITLFLFGGVAELGSEPTSAASEFFMAIAGPAVSAILAALFWFGANAGNHAHWPLPWVLLLGYLAEINFMVLVFNLVPAFPLDGGRVFRSLIWWVSGNLRRATYWSSLLGQAFGWFLIALGVYNFITDHYMAGIWSGLIGMFVANAAKQSYQQVIIRQALEGEPVRRFMNTEPIVVPPTLDLARWVQDYVYRFHRKAFPVATDGTLEGFISTRALAQFPREQWPEHTVGEVMRRDLRAVTISPDTDALQALSRMQRTGFSRLLVAEEQRLVGIISLKDLLRFLHLKLELEDVEE